MIELIGIGAAIFELLALYLLTVKNRLGFLLGICGNITWILYTTISKNAIGLILVCSVAFILNIKGLINWKK